MPTGSSAPNAVHGTSPFWSEPEKSATPGLRRRFGSYLTGNVTKRISSGSPPCGSSSISRLNRPMKNSWPTLANHIWRKAAKFSSRWITRPEKAPASAHCCTRRSRTAGNWRNCPSIRPIAVSASAENWRTPSSNWPGRKARSGCIWNPTGFWKPP